MFAAFLNQPSIDNSVIVKGEAVLKTGINLDLRLIYYALVWKCVSPTGIFFKLLLGIGRIEASAHTITSCEASFPCLPNT